MKRLFINWGYWN